LERRNLFTKIFGGKQQPPQQQQKFELLNNISSYFSPFSGTLMDSDIVRSAVRPIVNAVGKLKPNHMAKGRINPQPYLRRLLERPNPYMSMQDFLMKMTWQRELTHNAFAYVKTDRFGYAEEIYPIPYSSVDLVQVNNEPYAKFMFWSGKTMAVPYTDLIHLRKDFNTNDFYGDSGTHTVTSIMEVINTTDQSIVNAVRNSAVLKWILKFKSVLKPEDREIQVKDFVKNFLSITNQGGAAASDPRYDLEQVKDSNYVPNALIMDKSVQRVFSYFGVNDNIVQNKYDEDQWNAFYSSVIEPIAIQLSDAFTYVLFTEKERSFGNKILFSANRLTFASNTTKINMARDLIPLGLFTVNEMREIMELEPVEGGDKRIQTLNVVNADKADEYQMGQEEVNDDAEGNEVI
jgi:HK97 family phage portal protein